MQVKSTFKWLFDIYMKGGNPLRAGIITLFNNLKSFFSSPLGSLGGSLTSIFAAYKAFKAIDNKVGLTYNGAYGNTSKSLKSVQDTKSEVDDLQSKVDEYKESLQQIATNNDIDVSGLESVDAIIQKINSVGGISLVDQAEVQKIQVANTQLEGTLKNKQNILSQEQKEAAADAEKNLKKKVNPNVKKSKDGTYEYVGTNGVAAGTGAKHQNIIDATAQDLKGYQEYSDKIAKLREKQSKATSASESKAIEKQIKEAETAKDKIGSSLDSRQEELSTMMKALSVNGEGVEALAEHSEGFNNLKSIVNAISDKDLSGTEKALSSLNTFFDGSTGKNAIKNRLQDAVNSGNDLSQTLSRMGLSLDDLGIDKIEQLQSYLDKASESAKKTSNAIDSVDGTVTSVGEAFDSANKDEDWKNMSKYLSEANDLYDKGKIGTDDFKESAQFLTWGTINPDSTKYDATAYSKAWEKAEEKRKRYFDSDNPNDSRDNFVSDLVDKGLAKKGKNDDITWTKEFNNSAAAAKKLGISVSAVETLMRNLQSYGGEFDKVTWSGENLKSYKKSLSGIKDIYDNMDEGDDKDTLGTKIQGWDKNLKKYNKDMSTLTKDQVVKIKFEYDLASIKQEIQKLQKIAEEGGDSQSWAEANAEQSIYRDKAEKAKGNKVTDKKIGSKSYQNISNNIAALKDQLSKASSEQEKVAIQQKINEGYQLQNKMNDGYIASGKSWTDFKESADFVDIAKELKAYNEKANQEVADILGIDKDEVFKQHTKKDDEGETTAPNKNDKTTTQQQQDKFKNVGIDTPSKEGKKRTSVTSPFPDKKDSSDKTKSTTRENVEEQDVRIRASVDTSEAEKAIDKIEHDGDSKKITMQADASTDQVESEIQSLETGNVLEFTANVDGVESQVTAVKDEDGTVTYTADVNGTEETLIPILQKDGTIIYTSNIDSIPQQAPTGYQTIVQNPDSSQIQNTNPVDQTVNRKPNDNNIKSTKSVDQTVKRNADNKNILSAPTIFQKVIRFFTGGGGNQNGSTGGSKKSKDGTGGLNGTAHVSGTAHVNGNLQENRLPDEWKTNKANHGALTGELGQELVVYGNRWWTVGDNGAEFTDIPKGAVIFNHKQTEQLFDKGYINSRGTGYYLGSSFNSNVDDLFDSENDDAFLNGSAFANGIPIKLGGSSISTNKKKKTTKSTTSSTTKKTKSNSDKSKKKTTGKGKTALEKFQDYLSKFFDWIEVRLKKLQTQTERFEKKAENSRTLKGVTSNYEKAYRSTKSEVSTNKKAVTRYRKQANIVKNEAIKRKIVKPKDAKNLIKKIKYGTININAYGEKTQEFIKAYQEYWDKAEECRTNQLDLQKQLYELEQKKLDSITDYYDTLGNLYKSQQEIYSSSNDLIKSSGGSEGINSTYYKNLISQRSKQAVQTSTLQQEKNAYAKELKTAKKRFGSNSNEAREAQIKYNEIVKELNDSKTAYEDLNSQIREVTYNLSQWVIDKWSGVADRLSAAASLFKVKDTSNETRRKNLENTYTAQRTANNNTIVYYEKLRNDKIMERDKYKKDSTEWNKLNSEVSELDIKMLGLASDNEELKDSIQELRFEPFEKMNESIDDNISDMEHLIDLMGDTETVSEDAVITDAGNAQILLNVQKINQAQEAISNYKKEMAGLETMYKNGQMSEEDYLSKKREIIEAQQKEASTVKDSRNAILQIYKDSLQKENDLLQKNITKRKEALQNKKDYYNYDKTLKEKNKNINILKNEIAALEGTSNAAAKARLEELKAQLKDAQDDYDETVRDHEDEIRSEGYDKIAEDASDALDKTLKALDSNSKMQTDVVNKMLDNMVESYDEAYAKIRDIIKSSGTAVSDVTEKATSQTKEDLDTTVTNVKNGSTSSSPTLGDVDTSIIKGGANESKADKAVDQIGNQASKPEPTLTQEGQERKKASDDQAKKEADQKTIQKQQQQQNIDAAKKEKDRKISDLKSNLADANSAYNSAWHNTEKHIATMEKSSYWKYISDAKKKKIKNHQTISTKSLKKGKGLEGSQKHNDYAEKEKLSKQQAQKYVNDLKKLGVNASVVKPSTSGSKKAKEVLNSSVIKTGTTKSAVVKTKIKGYATGGIADELVPVNDITKVIPALCNVITSNGDEGLITARLGEMILPEKPVKNLVPDFISNVEKANAMMKTDSMRDINIENNLIVQGSIDKDTFPGVKKMQEMSYDYIVKQLTDQRQKSGYKTKL